MLRILSGIMCINFRNFLHGFAFQATIRTMLDVSPHYKTIFCDIENHKFKRKVLNLMHI